VGIVNFNEILDSMSAPDSAAEMLRVVTTILTASDMTPDDRAGFATGFLCGVTYTLSCHTEGDIRNAAQTFRRLANEWEANGVIA
jgi:hypothetical protein